MIGMVNGIGCKPTVPINVAVQVNEMKLGERSSGSWFIVIVIIGIQPPFSSGLRPALHWRVLATVATVAS